MKKKHNVVGDFFYFFIKRIVDILVSLIGMILLIPITIIIKIAYMLDGDFHSIFFVQERIGLNGKKFKMFKYRTMIINADKELEKILKTNKELALKYHVNKKLSNDPRITHVGRIIRHASIDELPQMINVFFGDMSLIGNRPYLEREIIDMGSYYDDIIITKPGISGLWQTSGRSNTTFLTRCKLEAKYSKNRSLWLDTKLFFKTFKVILKGL